MRALSWRLSVGGARIGASAKWLRAAFAQNVIIVMIWTRSDAVIGNTNDRKGSPEVRGRMIANGPGAQYRRSHSFGRVHKRADVGSSVRSRNHMLDPSLTGFGPVSDISLPFFGTNCSQDVAMRKRARLPSSNIAPMGRDRSLHKVYPHRSQR